MGLLFVASTAADEATAPASANAAATAAYASAAALHNREAWDLAAEEWQALLAAHPDDPLALRGRHYLAICQEKLGRWPEASKTLEAAIASRADSETAALARWDLGRGSFAAAQARPGPDAFTVAAKRLGGFLAAHPAHPRAAEASRLRGESLWQAGQREEAVAVWETFVRDHAAALAAVTLLELDQPAAALSAADAFLPGPSAGTEVDAARDMRAVRAEALLALGKPADAAAAYGELATRSPARRRCRSRHARLGEQWVFG